MTAQPVEIKHQDHRLRLDDDGVTIDHAEPIPWSLVAAVGVETRMGFRRGLSARSGAFPGIAHGCVAFCVTGNSEPQRAYALPLLGVGKVESASEREVNIVTMREAFGDWIDRFPAVAPPGVNLQAWWVSHDRSQSDHAPTSHERAEDIRHELDELNRELDNVRRREGP